MTIPDALARSMAAEGWNMTRTAYEVGVTEQAVRRWIDGRNVPNGGALVALLEKLPGFRAALEERVAS